MATLVDECLKPFLCSMGRLLSLSIFLSIFCSCSDKYGAFRGNYQFKSKNGVPDYGDLQYWAAHPYKWDPSDSVPLPLQYEPRDSSADVFFIHPTTYTKRIKNSNALIDDDYINAKTDYT